MNDGLPEQFPRNGTSSALEASRVTLAGSGRVYGFTVYNSNAAAQFILVFDQSTVPADGETADVVLKAPAGDVLGVNWLPGRWFRSGCVLCNSSTAPTKTVGAADCFFDVQYESA
jgi:hypothetical protein